MNLGAALVWQVWWALLPLLILLTARAWCAVCPFPVLGDAVQRLSPLSPGAPSLRLRRAAPWLSAAALGVLGFLFLLSGLETNGPMTASLLLAFALAAAAAGALWRRRVWCRYLCPVGLMTALYSRLSWLRLEPTGDRQTAASGSLVCTFLTSPVSERVRQDCALCGACMRAPGGASIGVRVRTPSLDRPPLALPEALAVSLLLGLLLVDAVRMTPLYLRYMAWGVSRAGLEYDVTVALGIGGVVAALLAAQLLLVAASGPLRQLWSRWAHQSMALLPLVLAAQLALSAQHLIALPEVLRNVGAELRLLEPGHMPPADAYAVLWPLKLLQVALLLAAIAISLGAFRRKPAGYRLSLAVVAVPATALLFTFAQPMSVSC
jgi:hypothetical protein